MPSSFGHALFAVSLTPYRPFRGKLLPTMIWAMICACIPDLDVIGFEMGIRYGDMLGHRGFTHSLVFALLSGWLVSHYGFRDFRQSPSERLGAIVFFFMCSCSHGLLDAMTDGGLGVGFFIPFSSERYFFSYRPIPVSPMSVMSFFTEYGWQILKSELAFIGSLSIPLLAGGYFWRRRFIPRDDS